MLLMLRIRFCEDGGLVSCQVNAVSLFGLLEMLVFERVVWLSIWCLDIVNSSKPTTPQPIH